MHFVVRDVGGGRPCEPPRCIADALQDKQALSRMLNPRSLHIVNNHDATLLGIWKGFSIYSAITKHHSPHERPLLLELLLQACFLAGRARSRLGGGRSPVGSIHASSALPPANQLSKSEQRSLYQGQDVSITQPRSPVFTSEAVQPECRSPVASLPGPERRQTFAERYSFEPRIKDLEMAPQSVGKEATCERSLETPTCGWCSAVKPRWGAPVRLRATTAEVRIKALHTKLKASGRWTCSLDYVAIGCSNTPSALEPCS
jgi:hypothetical protein